MKILGWRAAALLFMGVCAATPAYAQRTVHNTLRTARNANWYVRVATQTDSAEGRVSGLFRDTVRIGRDVAIHVPDIVRVERRAGDGWRSVWTAAPGTAVADMTDTATVAAGSAVFVYAGTTAVLLPGLFYMMPPPVTLGLEVAVRGRNGDYTVGARTLAYPLPLAIGVMDVGVNFRARDRRYSGLALGAVFPTEGEFRPYPMVSMRGGVLPRKRGGARFELRSDAFFGDGGVAILASLHLGLHTSFDR